MPRKIQEPEVGIQLKEFGIALGQIADEKGISKEKVLEIVEASLAAAYKKDYGKKGQHLRCEFDSVSGSAEFYLIQEVVDESTREFVDEEAEEGTPESEGKLVKDEQIKEIKEIKKNKEVPEAKKEEGKKEEQDKDSENKDSETQEEEERLPRYNAERDLTLEEAQEKKADAQIGDVIETKLESHDTFGRVAAQTAKQVILQKIREAEREAMFAEYKEREHEVVNGTVHRIEGHTVFIDLGKSTGVLLPGDQVHTERYRIGQRLKVFVKSVGADSKSPGIMLSRTSEELVRKMFELEVPEIFSGSVEIKSISREAGSRTKIAVFTEEEGIDPIGSCVGQKGTRVQSIIDELGGEKIDIIEWREDPKDFIKAALSPAKVVRVELLEEEDGEGKKKARVIVPQEQLSLAIGRQGQNVRLAARLTGYNLDMVGEEDINKPKEEEETTEQSEQSESGGVEILEDVKTQEETQEITEGTEESKAEDSAKGEEKEVVEEELKKSEKDKKGKEDERDEKDAEDEVKVEAKDDEKK